MARKKITPRPPHCATCQHPAEPADLVEIPLADLALPSPIHRTCLSTAVTWHSRFRLEVAGLLLRIHDLEAELARPADVGRLHRTIDLMRAALAPKLLIKGSAFGDGERPDWWGCQVCSASSLVSPDAIIHRFGCIVVAEA